MAALEIETSDVAAALAEFDTLWDTLVPKEQVRVLALLIERIDYDGELGNIDITFRPTGMRSLAADAIEHEETAA